MAKVVLFHHVLGLTDGVKAFAQALRDAGHEVETPDLFDGVVFRTLEEGMAFVERIGFDRIIALGEEAARPSGPGTVYGGFSLGVLPAQKLAQTDPQCRGALLYHASVPVTEFGTSWPAGVPLQIHVAEEDELGDVPIAEEIARSVNEATLYLYPGSGHLFTDSTREEFDVEARRLVLERTLKMLDRIETYPLS